MPQHAKAAQHDAARLFAAPGAAAANAAELYTSKAPAMKIFFM